MKNLRKYAVAASLLLFGAAGCADLGVVNENDPERERALASAEDVVSLIGGSYSQWFRGQQLDGNTAGTPGLFLAAAAFEWSSTAANFGILQFSRIPREPVPNSATHQEYGFIADAWIRNYRAIAAVSEGMRALTENEDLAADLSDDELMQARIFARFMQGLAHGSLALLYDRAYVVDEEVAVVDDAGAPVLLGEPQGYQAVMTAALGYFDEAIALASSADAADVEIPSTWIAATGDVGMTDFVKLMYAMKARYRANVARTPAERAAVNWAQLLVETQRAIKSDWITDHSYVTSNWGSDAIYYPSDPTFGQATLFIIGMADTSGMYQQWLAVPVADRQNNLPNGTPVLIHTPDNRFPRGANLTAQLNDTTAARRAQQHYRAANNLAWNRPERGSWRWSYYTPGGRTLTSIAYATEWPLIRAAEIRLLAAEGLFRTGALGAAADSINVSRVPAGLNAATSTGTNTSCVPKLPNGTCGNLFEQLKWEKRMETFLTGPYLSTFYFDGRGWGDLYRGTPLQFPIPDEQVQVLGLGAAYTFGGVGGTSASTGSTYAWPGE